MRTLSALVLLLTLGSALAQQPGGQGKGGAGAGTPGGAGVAPSAGPTTGGATQSAPGNLPRRQPDFGQSSTQQQQRDSFERWPIFFSGRVMLEDGTPPSEPVIIEIVCNDEPRPQAYTDSKGHFSFQLGQQTGMIMDASVPSVAAGQGMGRDPSASDMGGTPGRSSMGTVRLMGCELRASSAGYRSEAIMLGLRSIFDNPDIGTIILRRLANVQGTAISLTTLAAPKDAKKSYEKAQKILRQKNPKQADAVKELEKAVEIYPQFAAAWYLLGEARLALRDEDGARKAFEKSVATDGKYVNPYVQLAALNLRAGHWADAAEITSRLTQLNPYIAQAHYFNAIANYNLGKMGLAEKSARNVVKNDAGDRFPMAHQLLGAILVRQGDFPSAAEEFRSFLKLSPNSPAADQLRKQLSEWEGLGVIQRPEAPKQDSPK